MLIIHKAKVRRMALDQAAQTRRLADGSPRFTRVSQQFYVDLDAHVRTLIHGKVHSLPSAGRTI